MPFAFWLFIELFFSPAKAVAAPIDVDLITYYDYPPFVLDDSPKGLTQELADYLSQHSAGRYQFQVKVLPKGRLDILMNDPLWKGVVAWTNPKFVYDEAQTRFQWTAPIMKETDLVAFHRDNPIDFQGPESLRGRKIGMVLNQRYADVEAMIEKGELTRQNAPSQENVVNMLIYQRVDVAFVSKSTLSWFRNHLKGFDQKILFAPKPRNSFNRHLMLTKGLPLELREYVNATLQVMSRQPPWLDVMNRFHIPDQVP